MNLGTSQRCTETRCGSNANCIEGPNRVNCVCPTGMQGNPFLGCQGEILLRNKKYNPKLIQDDFILVL